MRSEQEVRMEVKRMRTKIREDNKDPEVGASDIMYLQGFIVALKWSLGEENQ
jgi:hypothetical protein